MIETKAAVQVAVELINKLFLPKMITGGNIYLRSLLDEEREKTANEACEISVEDFDTWIKAHLKREILDELYWQVFEIESKETSELIQSSEQAAKRRAMAAGLVEQAEKAESEFDCANALANYMANKDSYAVMNEWHKVFNGNEYESIDKISYLSGGMTVGEYLEITGLFDDSHAKTA